MEAFGLNVAQEYAINIFCRDKMLPVTMLANYIDEIMTIDEIATVLGEAGVEIERLAVTWT